MELVKNNSSPEIAIDQLVEYATEDAEVTLLLAELLEEKLTAEKLESLYSEIDLLSCLPWLRSNLMVLL